MPVAAPSLSVVIPSHHTRELTLACLATLERARGEVALPLEVVVVDDASRDGTAETIRERFPATVVLTHETARGFSAAANRGLDRAMAPLLLLLNSDTEMPPGSLPRLLEAFAGRPELGIAGAALSYPDGRPQWSGGAAPTLPWLFALASGLPALLARLPGYRSVKPARGERGGPVEWVTGAAMAMRREVWRQAGPLDEEFAFYGQDLDFCLRAGGHGWRVEVLPAFMVVHHHGGTIGRGESGGGHQKPELLWADLLRWAERSRGREWARRAARWLHRGARLRLLARRAAAPFVPPPRRPVWRRHTEVLERAAAELTLSWEP